MTLAEKTLLLKLMHKLRQCEEDNNIDAKNNLLEAYSDTTVSIAELALVMNQTIKDLAQYADLNMSLEEYRLQAIISSLPEDIQTEIKNKFKEAEDDFLEGDEENE
jgi:hypothetical protein